MKKTQVTGVLAMLFVLLIGSCATTGGSVENARAAARKIWEASYYASKYEVFKFPDESYTEVPSWQYAIGNGTVVSMPDWVEREPLSAQDIDRAIACYEEALKIQPSGTWKLPNGYPAAMWEMPPALNIKNLLQITRDYKAAWAAIE